jgi:hypothetical protein
MESVLVLVHGSIEEDGKGEGDFSSVSTLNKIIFTLHHNFEEATTMRQYMRVCKLLICSRAEDGDRAMKLRRSKGMLTSYEYIFHFKTCESDFIDMHTTLL